MSKPVIVFDVDGTLLDFVGGFKTWMATQGHATDHDHHAIGQHDHFFKALYPHLAHLDGREWIGRFGQHTDFEKLSFLEGVHATLNTLRQNWPGCRLHAVSSMGPDPMAVAARTRNLSALPLDDFTALEFGQLKAEKLQELNAQLFFDDHPDQIAAAEAVNIHAVLVHQPWNRSHAVRYRLNHWGEAPTLASQLLEKAKIST